MKPLIILDVIVQKGNLNLLVFITGGEVSDEERFAFIDGFRLVLRV